MRRIAVLTIALFCVFTTRAQTLYQCAGRNGNSYQQTPCAGSVRLVRTLETTPEPPLTKHQLQERAGKAAQDRAESEFLSRLAGTDGFPMRYTHSDRSPRRRNSPRLSDACGRARASRERRLAVVGLDRTLDLLRQLDADVEVACQGD